MFVDDFLLSPSFSGKPSTELGLQTLEKTASVKASGFRGPIFHILESFHVSPNY